MSESEELSLEDVFELSLEYFNGGVILFFGDEGFAKSFPSSGIAFCSTLKMYMSWNKLEKLKKIKLSWIVLERSFVSIFSKLNSCWQFTWYKIN